MKIPFSPKPNKTQIAAVGSALVDMCLLEDDVFLELSGAKKGGMVLVDDGMIKTVLSRSQREPAVVPGGSACNTILGIGALGGKAFFVGKRGTDSLGELFEGGLLRHKVTPKLFTSSSPTGHVLSIITPDAQRSMFTYLGASAETRPDEITPDLFAEAALVHLEGYLLFNPDLLMAAIRSAKAHDALISLDLASYTVVEASRTILDKITRSYVDILIANEDEARSFTGETDEDKAIAALAQKAAIAVLKLGKRGSIIAHNSTMVRIEPMGSGSAVDTTGAGDLWAAGFLYGLVHGYSLEKCGLLGSACGYEVCQVVGATIPEDGWSRVRKLL